MQKEINTTDFTAELNQEPFPQIAKQVDNLVILQRGLYDPTTQSWEKTAEVRELTGYDEERLATVENRKNITYAEYMTEVLKLGVVSIGDLDFSGRLNELALGDRDALFLGIVRTTYGRERTFTATCPSCKDTNQVTLDLYDDFPVQEPSFDPTIGSEVTLRKGNTVRITFPTAEDSLFVAKNSKTGAEQNTLMLSRCVHWEGEEGIDKEAWARSLNLADRNTLVQALLDAKMGPKVGEVDIECVHCGASMPVMIDWIFLIFG